MAQLISPPKITPFFFLKDAAVHGGVVATANMLPHLQALAASSGGIAASPPARAGRWRSPTVFNSPAAAVKMPGLPKFAGGRTVCSRWLLPAADATGAGAASASDSNGALRSFPYIVRPLLFRSILISYFYSYTKIKFMLILQIANSNF